VRLSPHFTLAELTKSQTAIRRRIRNEPHPRQIENLKKVCEHILEPVRVEYDIPFSPSSGFRCLDLNRELGSSDTSQHIQGKAVDFELPGIANPAVARWVLNNCEFDQLILEFFIKDEPNSGWIHASFDHLDTNRKVAKRFDGKIWEPFK